MKLLLPETPDRVDVLQRLKALPELPEAERMRTKPALLPVKKSRWQAQADRILRRRLA